MGRDDAWQELIDFVHEQRPIYIVENGEVALLSYTEFVKPSTPLCARAFLDPARAERVAEIERRARESRS